ncbi:MAG TPA: methyl-accepting chemotaxis protein [Caldithrix abyssi]|uniref:Methyl-accepting chemotaxis protein n=1 Tax=Caldithrix abyssi TaxID=187145 RepID=A0A7V1LP91_CALAY|nr:methyl-accepting chemotaxis protein [Caldithrix abyssi]
MKSIKSKLIVLLLTFALLPLLITGWNNMSHNREILKEEIQKELKHVAALKQSSLEAHLNMIAHEAGAIAHISAIKHFLQNTESAVTNNPAMNQAYDVILQFQEKHWGIFHHIFITDPAGVVVLSPGHNHSAKSHLGQDVSASPFFHKALSQPQVTDFFGFAETDHYHQLYLQPVKNENNETLGVIVFEVKIDYVNHILNDGFKLGNSGKLFLATLKLQPVVEKKSDFSGRLSQPGLQAALSQGHAFSEFTSPGGGDKVGVYLRSEKYPWIIGVEIDQDEVYAPINDQLSQFIVVFLIAGIIVGVAGFIFGSSFARPIKEMVDKAKQIAGGDLDVRIDYQGGDELGELATALNDMVHHLKNVIFSLSKNTELLNNAAEELVQVSNQMSVNSQNLNEKANNVASATEEMSVTMETISSVAQNATTNISTVAGSSENITQNVSQIAANAQQAQTVTHHAVEEIETASGLVQELNDSVLEINQVSEVISEIAEQTKLLALNATIEAARAGEAGKGFAVVANEVKELARQTNESTEQITQRIEAIQNSTRETIDRFKRLHTVISDVNNIVSEITDAVAAQSYSTRDINNNIVSAADGMNEMSANINESANVSKMIASDIIQVHQVSDEVIRNSGMVDRCARNLSEISEGLSKATVIFKTGYHKN